MKVSFNGFILFLMAVILFAAASNTQSGWQYIIASFIFAFLVMGIVFPFFLMKKILLSKSVPSRLYSGKDSTIFLSLTSQLPFKRFFYSIVDAPLITEVPFFLLEGRLNLLAFIAYKLHNLFIYKEYSSKLFMKILPPNQIVEFGYDFVPNKRGIHKTGSMTVSTSFPFGLFSFSRSFNPDAEVIVYPKLVEIRGGWINRISHKSVMSQFSNSYMPTSIPGTTRGLRAYVPGDSPRHIHWPNSAKTGNLLVREFEIESSGFVYIVLDSCASYESESYFELAVTTVASMLNACHTEGLTAIFSTQNDSYEYNDTDKKFDWETQLEVLARVKPVSTQSICRLIDSINQEVLVDNKIKPSYVLVSPFYKADESANKSNIVSVVVSSVMDDRASYTITSESDLKYV
ncbi:MAG: DUF58 domain-containing protein [Vampirovibrionia bacterium]